MKPTTPSRLVVAGNTAISLPEIKVYPHRDLVPNLLSCTTDSQRRDADASQSSFHVVQLHASEALTEKDTMICVVPMYHLTVCTWWLTRAQPGRHDRDHPAATSADNSLKTSSATDDSSAPGSAARVERLAFRSWANTRSLEAATDSCGAAPLAPENGQACSERWVSNSVWIWTDEVSPLSHSSLPSKPDDTGICRILPA